MIVLALALAVGFVRHQYAERRIYYSELARRRPAILAGRQPDLAVGMPSLEVCNQFRIERLLRVEGFLTPESLDAMRQECLANVENCTRSYVPTHKQGGAVSYEQIHDLAPNCLAFFHSPRVHDWLRAVIGETVVPTADHDQSTCSLLIYHQPGDHIQWHYDHNFYKGRHFTVLLSVVNRSQQGGLASGTLQRKLPSGEITDIQTQENVLVLFEGARTLHRVTPIQPGEFRAMLSMTFATDPTLSWHKEVLRRCKDVAFFGSRVLWN